MQKTLERKDPAKMAACACGNLRAATRAITQFYDQAFQPIGLGAPQVSVLGAIDWVGEGAIISEVAKFLTMDRTTLTRNLKPLLSQGLVRIHKGKDQRTRRLSLTAKGRETLVRAIPLWEKAQAQVVQKLGPERFSSLLTDLSTIKSLAG